MIFKIMQYILVFILVVIGLNYLITESFMSKYILNHSIDQKLELLEDNRKPDMFIFGSSIPERGISGKTLSLELSAFYKQKIDVFNFSLSSGSLMEQSFLLEMLIDHGKKPKAILLTYTAGSDFKVVKDKDIYYASLYVYDKAITYSGMYELWSDYSMPIDKTLDLFLAKTFKFYLYRKDIKKNFKNYIKAKTNGRNFNPKEVKLKGINFLSNINGDISGYIVAPISTYKRHYSKTVNSVKRYTKQKNNFDGMKGMNRMIKIAKEEGIIVYLSYIPERLDFSMGYKYNENIAIYINKAKNIASKYAKQKNITLLDPTKNMYLSPLSTTDTFHLNQYSAKKMSQYLSQKLISINDFQNIKSHKVENNISKNISWNKKYSNLHNLNLNTIKVKNTKLLFKYFDENDYIFIEALQNVSIDISTDELGKLIDLVFTKYNRNNMFAQVRYVEILNKLCEVDLTLKHRDKIVNYLDKSLANMRPYRRINASLKLIEHLNQNQKYDWLVLKYVNKVNKSNRLKKDWSSLIYANSVLDANSNISKILTDEEVVYLNKFITLGAVK